MNRQLFGCMGTQDDLLVSVFLPRTRERRDQNLCRVCSLLPRMTEKKGAAASL